MIKFSYPVQAPIIDDLHNAYLFNGRDGEDELSFVKCEYQRLAEDNRRQFSTICNQDLEIAQLRRKVQQYEEAIRCGKLVDAERIRIKLSWEVA